MPGSPSRQPIHRQQADAHPDLSLTEWAVLGILAAQPAHGFAVARQLERDSIVGRVWSVQRPLVYRAVGRLEEQGLISPQGTEPGAGGPQRTVYSIERRGRAALDWWLGQPVEHLRAVRTELLLKLMLCRQHGVDPRPLLERQQEVFEPLLEALVIPSSGPVDPVARWRYESSQAVARFLEGLLAEGPPNP